EVAGLPDSRIYGLGAHDNFWQMADTGPCGPCSEIFIDLAYVAKDFQLPRGAKGEWTEVGRKEFSKDAFVEGAEAGRFLEFWNLVFMQFDQQPDGSLVPLPKPSVDTGAGLERIAAFMQGESNNFHNDLFQPLIKAVEKTIRKKYDRGEEGASFRVIADHSRAVAFLIADGVFPSNEGRGYVLRRILRRAVRHAWLLGRRKPTLVEIVRVVIDEMIDVYPELGARAKHIIDTTRAEEERFLSTIEGGMRRFDELAPARTTQGSTAIHGTISGEDAFKLYDTFGFPIDLTELMARERGYSVDIIGFESALQAQRAQSQDDGWPVDIDEVRKVDGRIAALGKVTGNVELGRARAIVPRDRRRDTERNHTATHILHAALRQVLGEHVHQEGSLVAPDRLRFDFSHHGPLTPQQLNEVETLVNRGILDGVQLTFEQKPQAEAKAAGAMSLFTEKYGAIVRVVTIPGISMELCGGTHVRNTSEIGVFKIVSETGIAAGVRRIEALTGRAALDFYRAHERQLQEIEHIVRAPSGQVVKRVQTLVDERRTLEKRLEDAMRSGGGGAIKSLVDQGSVVNGVKVVAANVNAPDLPALQAMGDALREQMESGVGVLAASFEN